MGAAFVLAAVLAAQAGAGPSIPHVDATTVAPPVPNLVVSWVYPRSGAPRLIEQNIVPREQDVVRMHTADPADVVEAFYRSRVVAEGGGYSVVSAVNQRIVANATTVVTIESDGHRTVITVVANEPEPDPTPDPSAPFRIKKAFRPPPS